MTEHIHIYKVREMAEINLEIDSNEDVYKKAMHFKDLGRLRFRKPDYRTIVVDPGYGRCKLFDYNDSKE